MPAQSGLWASRACYPTELQRHRRAVRPMGEVPLANLCNRLVVTSTPGVTPSPSLGLSPSCPPRLSSRFSLGGSPAIRPWSSSATLDCHCWRLQPWVGHAVGAAPAGCCPTITLCRDARCPTLGSSGRCRPCSRPMIRLADAPCRCPQPVPGIPSRAARARARVPASQPKDADLQAQGAFHQQVPPSTPGLAPERRPHGPPLVPRLCHRGPSFRHAFTPPPRGTLDPRASRLFAGAPGPHAACQLLQWSVPRAHQRAARSPASAVASHVPPGDAAPCGAPSAGLPQVRGRLAFPPRRPPLRRPLAAVDLPQPDRPEHLLSRVRVAPRLEELHGSTALRCGPRFRTNPPGAPRSRSAHLVGPLPAPPRERKARTAAPEVPSTKETPPSRSRAVSPV
jgi:hypothetical protein